MTTATGLAVAILAVLAGACTGSKIRPAEQTPCGSALHFHLSIFATPPHLFGAGAHIRTYVALGPFGSAAVGCAATFSHWSAHSLARLDPLHPSQSPRPERKLRQLW